MSKKLRREPIYIAPDILGYLDEKYQPVVVDERNNTPLDVNNDFHKILVYERQVKEWFLEPAKRFLKEKNRGFIVLMICLSYLEGVEQYRKGKSSHQKSKKFFVSALRRIYPDKYDKYDLENFYRDARCGLFHTGMVQGKIVINYDFPESIDFPNPVEINVNPKMLLFDIEKDFENFINELKNEEASRKRFSSMYSNI